MRNKRTMLLALPLLVTACGGVKTVTETVHSQELWLPPVPEVLLDCAAAPAPLSGDYGDPEVAGYLLELHSAWRDCKGTVADWAGWHSKNSALIKEGPKGEDQNG